jgi:hypothetical protein
MSCIYLLYNEAGYGYIGKTTNIKKRLRLHEDEMNATRSKLLGEWKCEVLEKVDNDCLDDYERYYYDMYNEMFPNMLVNKYKPLRTKKEWDSLNKPKYYEKNKGRILQKINCECGGSYRSKESNRHFKTAKHQNFTQHNT